MMKTQSRVSRKMYKLSLSFSTSLGPGCRGKRVAQTVLSLATSSSEWVHRKVISPGCSGLLLESYSSWTWLKHDNKMPPCVTSIVSAQSSTLTPPWMSEFITLTPLTCEQDPKILGLLQLGPQIFSNLKGAVQPFLAEDHHLVL